MSTDNTDKLDPAHVAWSQNVFRMITDGGVWGVPRSGLMFTKRGDKLVLTARMPHMAGMPCSAAELAEQQQDDYEGIKRHMEAAGITVEDASS
jgi:hypothetical protein